MFQKRPKELRINDKRKTEAEEKWDTTLQIACCEGESPGKQGGSIE